MSKQVCVKERIEPCIEHEWSDLLERFETITQNLVDYPQIGTESRQALLHWCSMVDDRSKKIPVDETFLAARNPSMSDIHFGTEI